MQCRDDVNTRWSMRVALPCVQRAQDLAGHLEGVDGLPLWRAMEEDGQHAVAEVFVHNAVVARHCLVHEAPEGEEVADDLPAWLALG